MCMIRASRTTKSTVKVFHLPANSSACSFDRMKLSQRAHIRTVLHCISDPDKFEAQIVRVALKIYWPVPIPFFCLGQNGEQIPGSVLLSSTSQTALGRCRANPLVTNRITTGVRSGSGSRNAIASMVLPRWSATATSHGWLRKRDNKWRPVGFWGWRMNRAFKARVSLLLCLTSLPCSAKATGGLFLWRARNVPAKPATWMFRVVVRDALFHPPFPLPHLEMRWKPTDSKE